MDHERTDLLVNELERLVEKLKGRAEQLLERYGIPTIPPRREPVPRVRMRALTEKAFPGAGESSMTFSPGQEFVTDSESADRHEADGWAERIGSAPPRTPPEPRPLMESGSSPFLEWSFDLAEGRAPALWEEWGIKLPPKRKRTKAISALSYAAAVVSLKVEVDLAIEASSRLRREGAAGVDVRLMLASLSQVLLLFSGIDPEHVRYGATGLDHLDQVRPDQGPAEGLLAATKAVYRPGLTEAETWRAVTDLKGKTVETAGGSYTIRLDSADGEIVAVYQVSEGGLSERSVKRSSFYNYFRLARDAASAT